jgi:hypothetical protein
MVLFLKLHVPFFFFFLKEDWSIQKLEEDGFLGVQVSFDLN